MEKFKIEKEGEEKEIVKLVERGDYIDLEIGGIILFRLYKDKAEISQEYRFKHVGITRVIE